MIISDFKGPSGYNVHQRSAERLLDLCCANRGTFIKVGQHLGALDYLLPEEYTSTLKVLHSRAPQSSMDEIRQVIREDLGKELSELFVSFEEKPQGTASLAQVHKAVLHDGRTVAVKVQHPKVQKQSSKDIVVMEVLLRAVHWLFPDFAFMWLVEEAKKNMPLELDFLNEGHNAEKVANMLAHYPFLKRTKHQCSVALNRGLNYFGIHLAKEVILTMEFAEGVVAWVSERPETKQCEGWRTEGSGRGMKVVQREWARDWRLGGGEGYGDWQAVAGEKSGMEGTTETGGLEQISEKLGKMYSEMIFVHGFVHCDPHPGNVLVRKCPRNKKTEIVLLDHGLYQ
ncbi:uncharacterized aarF domain-containing protein kinase 1 isoform X2, partial [Lates japonicus]